MSWNSDMYDKKTETKYLASGTSLSTLLTVLFVALKLLGKISWSWWWVLSPLWISAGLGVLIFIIFMIIAIWLAK